MSCLSHLFPLLVLLELTVPRVTARLAWTNIQTTISRDQLDLWTQKSSGCSCPNDVSDLSCACCVSNGCQCGGTANPQRCGQCGLEDYCDDMCNITISASKLKASSGQAFGEIKSPTTLSGPAFCWYRFEAEPGQRVELQVYRIKRLGEMNSETNRCVGGFMQLRPSIGDQSNYDPDKLAICGPNERYSPPVVMFEDPPSSQIAASATLLFRVDETTSRSQFLAHYAFPDVDNPDTGIAIKGGSKKEDPSSDCVWTFEESACQQLVGGSVCQIASPGYPGVYPSNKRCRYHIETSSKEVQIQVTFTRFNLPQDKCDTHYVEVFKGSNTNGNPLRSLCGYVPGPEVVKLERGKELTVEFVSGAVVPPINYSGFLAKIEFVKRQRSQSSDEAEGDEDEDDNEDNKRGGGGRRGGGRRKDADGPRRRPAKKPMSPPSNSDPATRCVQEFSADKGRTGIISSSSLSLNNQGCTLIFRGNPGDVLLITLNSFKLRGKQCESSIRISRPFSSMSVRRSSKDDTEEVENICSPATRKIYDGQGRYISRPPILVNSSTVFLQFLASKQNVDRFEAAFAFHDVLGDGLPSPNSSCDALFPGRTGHSKGTIRSPGTSDLFQRVEGPLQCIKSLVPSDTQSLTLTINSANDGNEGGALTAAATDSNSGCETLCDERGCHCLFDGNQPFSLIDHLMVQARNGGRIACFCGSFAHLLPLNVISSSTLSVVYNAVDFGADRRLSYMASYSFHNEETCGPRRISSPLGSLESPMAASPSQAYHPSSTYFHQECQWFFDPPPSRQLILKISTAQKMNDCLTWNATIAIWNASLPDQIGTLIDRFCPEISAKEYILNITSRKIVISLHSLSTGPIHYRISWETRGLLPRDPSGDHTKEVISGIGISAASSSRLVNTTSYLLLLLGVMTLLLASKQSQSGSI